MQLLASQKNVSIILPVKEKVLAFSLVEEE
jgi:hypothetical protein